MLLIWQFSSRINDIVYKEDKQESNEAMNLEFIWFPSYTMHFTQQSE